MKNWALAIVSCTFLMPSMVGTGNAQPVNFMEKTGDTSSLSSVNIDNDGYSHSDRNGLTSIARGQSKILEVDQEIGDVLVGDLAIVEVGAIKNNKLYLIGAGLGDTNITVFDKDGNIIREFGIHVRANEDYLRHTLKTLFPGENVEVKTINDDVVLSGKVSDPDTSRRMEQIATSFADQANAQGGTSGGIINLMSVRGEQQVSLEVKVMEVSRTILNELGVELGVGYTDSDFTGALASTSLQQIATTHAVAAAGDLSLGDFDISTFFSALERDGYTKTLAEPNLTAISGENARFLAGGEFPIISAAERDDQGNLDITYTYRPIGVALAFKPVVLAKNRINLNVSTEVSNVSAKYALSVAGADIPGFDVRRAETTVELPSGGTLLLAGLIQSDTLQRINQIPGVKDIPILDDLMSSESFQRNETELVILIRSFLIKPYADDTIAEKTSNDHNETPMGQAVLGNLREHYDEEAFGKVAYSQPIGYLLD